jgi:hypothetical protein
MDQDFEIYDGKNYSELVRNIVDNHKNKQSRIKALVDSLIDMVEDPGTAAAMVPTIKECLEVEVKNDEALVKLAQILSKRSQGSEGSDGGFSEKDLELLFSDIQKTKVEDIQVKELPSTIK